MEIKIHENDVRMLFKIDEIGRLGLYYVGTEECTSADYSNYRSAVEIGSTPGYGSWGKKVCTESDQLRYVQHRDYCTDKGRKLEFELKDDRFLVTLHYYFFNGMNTFRSWTEVKNISPTEQGLLFLSSFHYNGIPFGHCDEIMISHNGWGQEGIHSFFTPLELGLAQLDGRSITSTKVVTGNSSTFSTKDYLPMGYLGKKGGSGLFWEIEYNGAWSSEVSDNLGNLYISLSGHSESDGWYKRLEREEVFESVKCSISVGSSFQNAFESLTAYRRLIKGINTTYAKQPVIFNSFMHSLGTKPTDETVREMAFWAKKAGAEYYVLDAGWYSDAGWWDYVGEWKSSRHRFPNGLKSVFEYIRSIGLIPGIWLEPEVMGIICPLATLWPDECFYMRHGRRVRNRGRYQLDYRHPVVLKHMNDTVDRLVKEYGIGYFKFDYNIDAGNGTEVDSDSVADGLRKCAEAFIIWIDSLKKRYPKVIFENCASGSMRMNYDLLSRFHIQSTSDNEDFQQTAVIAANTSMGVLPEQAGIWVCPRPEMSERELIYTIVNGFAGVPYFGGRPNELGERFGVLCEGIEVYKSIRHEVSEFVPFWPLGLNNYNNRLHCVAYKAALKTYVILWQEETTGNIYLPMKAEHCECIYPKENTYESFVGENVCINLGEDLAAGVFVIY